MTLIFHQRLNDKLQMINTIYSFSLEKLEQFERVFKYACLFK